MTSTNNEIIIETKRDSLDLNGIIITSNEIYLNQTSSSGFNFNGVMVTGDEFSSQTGNQPSKLNYADFMAIINEAINNNLASEKIKDTILDIYKQIYKDVDENKMTIKNSEASNINLSDLIKFSNWRIK